MNVKMLADRLVVDWLDTCFVVNVKDWISNRDIFTTGDGSVDMQSFYNYMTANRIHDYGKRKFVMSRFVEIDDITYHQNIYTLMKMTVDAVRQNDLQNVAIALFPEYENKNMRMVTYAFEI